MATLLGLKKMGTWYRFLSEEFAETDAELAAIVSAHAPELLDVNGVGSVVASQLLVTFWDNPERMENEAAFAALAGVAPVPASSGKRNATGSPAAVTGKETPRFTASSLCA